MSITRASKTDCALTSESNSSLPSHRLHHAGSFPTAMHLSRWYPNKFLYNRYLVSDKRHRNGSKGPRKHLPPWRNPWLYLYIWLVRCEHILRTSHNSSSNSFLCFFDCSMPLYPKQANEGEMVKSGLGDTLLLAVPEVTNNNSDRPGCLIRIRHKSNGHDVFTIATGCLRVNSKRRRQLSGRVRRNKT